MSPREFHTKARDLLSSSGGNDVSIHDGTDAVSVRCHDGLGNTYVWRQPFGCRPESDVFDEAFENVREMAEAIAKARGFR